RLSLLLPSALVLHLKHFITLFEQHNKSYFVWIAVLTANVCFRPVCRYGTT
ncbi:hypothetical protein IRJ41_004248, partial [Triplophysa rosa]